MDARGVTTFVPQFRVRLPLMNRIFAQDARWLTIRASNGETVPLASAIQKSLSVHVDNCQTNRKFALNDGVSSSLPELAFNRLQLSEQEYCGLQRRNFGQFIAREAMLDEEYWTAAWLRTEVHWEALPCMRNADIHKRKFAEQAFYALKRRCSGQEGNSLKCFCLVAVKKEDKNVRRTVIKSIVGTLDISIRQYFSGETYPGEIRKSTALFAAPKPFDAHKYAYISNVCVSKYARRQGIATNMLYLAADVASFTGMKMLFVHVNADNTPAQELYSKCGLKFLETVSHRHLEDNKLLMYMEL
ncbi:unnamed protein product [Rhodiola kirilowii]